MSDGPRCGVVVLGSRLPCTRPLGHAGSCEAAESASVTPSPPRPSVLDGSVWRHPAGTQRVERTSTQEAIIARLRRIRAAIPEMTRPLALHVEEVDALLAAVDERDELRRQVCDMPDEVAARRAAAVQALREEAERRGLPPITTAGERFVTPPPSEGFTPAGPPLVGRHAVTEESTLAGLDGEVIAAPRVVRCECSEDYMCWAHGCGVLQPGETETTR